MMQEHILQFIYLVASVTFMIGLKMLSKPDTARKGNLIAAVGMGLAIFGTIFLYKGSNGEHLGNLIWIFAALIIGTGIGVYMAKSVQMTAMPQMVSFFNGMGGACAALISRSWGEVAIPKRTPLISFLGFLLFCFCPSFCWR